MRFLSALETHQAKLLAQASGLPVRQLPDQPGSEWEMQMLGTAMATLPVIYLEMEIAPETMSVLRRETAKDSA